MSARVFAMIAAFFNRRSTSSEELLSLNVRIFY